jgi:ribose 5-phosphate isomerase B
MKIAFGSDHVGYGMKKEIMQYVTSKGHECVDLGPFSTERVDYPDFAVNVAKAVNSGEYKRGILICGTGVGISIAANKVNGIRCVVCSEPYSAKLSREHNDTNILAFGARVVGIELAKMIVDEWIDTAFEGDRHQVRVSKIANIEQSNF